jgi:hypothetical protein
METSLSSHIEDVVGDYIKLITMASELYERNASDSNNLSRQIQSFTNIFIDKIEPLIDEVGKLEVEIIVEREMALNNAEALR